MMRFSFEELDVWQKAVDFAKEVIDLTGGFKKLHEVTGYIYEHECGPDDS